METWMWSVLMLVVALAIVLVEVFVPSGGVLGVLSTLAVLSSLVLAFMASLQFGLIMLILVSILIPVVIASALKWWPHTPLGQRILIQPPKSEDVLPDHDLSRGLKDMIGRRGIAKTKMLLSGSITIDGQTYDAVSEAVAIEPGQTVEVVALQMKRLVVRLVEDSSPAPPKKPTRQTNPDDLLSRPIDSLGIEPLDDPLA